MNTVRARSIETTNTEYIDVSITDDARIEIVGEVFGEGMSDNQYFDATLTAEQTRELYEILHNHYSTFNSL